MNDEDLGVVALQTGVYGYLFNDGEDQMEIAYPSESDDGIVCPFCGETFTIGFYEDLDANLHGCLECECDGFTNYIAEAFSLSGGDE